MKIATVEWVEDLLESMINTVHSYELAVGGEEKCEMLMGHAEKTGAELSTGEKDSDVFASLNKDRRWTNTLQHRIHFGNAP